MLPLGPHEKEKSLATPNEDSLFGATDPLLGKVMAERWEIVEFLGEGSMSVVYKARDVQSGRIVILKILHNSLVTNTKNLKRFELISKSLIELNHEGIGKVIDIHLAPDGQVFLVTEPLAGETLEQLLAKTGHLSVEQAVEIFSQVCEVLEYAHTQSALHRDLKPSNIMLLQSTSLAEEIKVLDFGIARLLSEESDDLKTSGYITHTREVFGSPMYMSPEQCMGKKLDARSDIYALGCVMYETLTGKPPFVGKNVLETAYKHMNETPRSILTETSSGRSLSRLETIIFKCLEKNPDHRYQLASQLQLDLQILLKATDNAWSTNAFALKKIAKIKKDKPKFKISFELGVLAGSAVLLTTIVAVWSAMFLGSESNEFPQFNNDLLFVVQERKRNYTDVPDFGSQEEAFRMDADSAFKDKGPDSHEHLEAVLHLSNLYWRAGRWNEAAEQFEKVIQIAPKADPSIPIPNVRTNLAYCYFQASALDKALENAKIAVDEFEQSPDKNSHMVSALYIVGDIYSQRNKLTDAVGVYDKLYQFADSRKSAAPIDYIQATCALADIYRRQNKLTESDRLYTLALDAATTYTPEAKTKFMQKVKYGYGLVLFKEGRYDEALASFKEALQIGKSLPPLNGGNKSALYGAIKKQISECLWKTNWFAAIGNKFSDGKQ